MTSASQKAARIWSGPSPMDTGSPGPVVVRRGEVAWVAYLARDPNFPGWEQPSVAEYVEQHPGEPFGVIRFDGVIELSLGPPSEDRLHEHPLYGKGLHLYSFHEVYPSEDCGSRWIVTFHDETLEVCAASARGFLLCFASTREEAIQIAEREA